MVLWKCIGIPVQAAKIFEGERYPTASSVIPFLDTVFDDLETLKHKVEGGAKLFVTTVLTNLKSQRRFPDGYKNLIPYNCLTLLDVRYEDLYFSKEEMEKTVHDLTHAKIYDDLMQGGGEGDGGEREAEKELDWVKQLFPVWPIVCILMQLPTS